jgi:MauM/NapG family ferredoxin protein
MAGVLSAGVILPGLAVFCVLMATSLVLGRFFCAYVCPLGTTFDLFYAILPVVRKSNGRIRIDPGWKHFFLILVLVSAILGLNLSHWGAPLSLAGRLYALVSKSLAFFALHVFDSQLCSGECLGLASPMKYQGLFLLSLIFGVLLFFNQHTKRFWCRYLCPAGGLLALLAPLSPVRRNVSEKCTYCGLCQRKCPMQAILDDPKKTDQSQCIVCHLCVRECPVKAIDFKLGYIKNEGFQRFWPGRRTIVYGMTVGIFGAFVGKQGLQENWSEKDKGRVLSQNLLRPPGSVPEPMFLNLCTRCGLCMDVCPSNMLQPALLEAGFSGIFSPVVVARRGACATECNACGQVCPTEAIRPLGREEKSWAKIGTAVIDQKLCLAWSFERSCLVCDEACPYGAIELKKIVGQQVAVPKVKAMHCTGCGYCEYSCPVQGQSAIRVLPLFEMRLKEGSYIQEGKRIGLHINRDQETEAKMQQEGLPPGFSD